MRPDEPHKYSANVKKNHSDQPIVIPFDVEYVAGVAHIVHWIEGLFQVGHFTPIGLFDSFVPLIEGISTVSVIFPELV